MKLILIVINALLPILVQSLIMHCVRNVSGGDIFSYLVVSFYLIIHSLIILLILRRRNELLKSCFLGIMLGFLICVYIFYNYNKELENTRNPHVEIGY